MKVWTTTALVAIGAVGLAAQATQQAPRVDETRSHSPQERTSGAITGCLVRAAAPGQYLLTVVISRDAEAAAAGEPRSVGTTGTNAADAADPVANSAAYRLEPKAGEVDLAAHVGKSVEITPAAGATSDAALPVASLRVVADRCE